MEEMNFFSFFHSSPDLLFVFNKEWEIIEVNRAATEKLSYQKDELLGRSIYSLHPPEYRQEAETYLREILDQRRSYCPLPLITKSGETLNVETNISQGLWNGEPAIFSLSKDVTERLIAEERLKENEQLLRKQNEEYAELNRELSWRNEQILMINKELQQASDIFTNIRTGMHIYHLEDPEDDTTLRMIGVNPAAERLIGIPAGDLLGNTLDENFPGLRALGIPQEYAKVVMTKTPKQFDEIIYGDDRIPTGAFTFNAFPLPDNCVGISFENVTDQFKAKQALIESNDQLIRAKEKAEESDRLKSAFLANMSHEIRTPMNGIMGFSMMLADPSLPKETRDSYVRIVNSSCEQLLQIVNDIIDISKIEAGQIEVNESPFDLKMLLNEVFTFHSSTAQEKGVRFEMDRQRCNLNSNSWIVTDRTKLRQILDNLIGNAVKFTPSGKIIIRCEMAGGYIHFEVEDTGIGIVPELQNVIFERFRQVESSYTRSYGGTGLGLAITKAYVEKLGGRISVRSKFGKGSAFSFMLPFKQAADVATGKEQVSKFRPLDLGMTVLIVEDEEINFLYLNEILKNRVNVLRAPNGREAIEKVKENQDIDIILMDIKLPDINGLELTKIIKSINSRIKVIAQTAYALSGDRESAIAAGCSGYISKPVNRDELLNLILAYAGK